MTGDKLSPNREPMWRPTIKGATKLSDAKRHAQRVRHKTKILRRSKRKDRRANEETEP
jgi:hypothetical protein